MTNSGSLDAVATSLWENKPNAEAYNTNTYPEVLKTFARMIDGTPKVQTFESVTLVGRVKRKLAPRGELSAAHKRPPCDSIIERLMRSPMPVP